MSNDNKNDEKKPVTAEPPKKKAPAKTGASASGGGTAKNIRLDIGGERRSAAQGASAQKSANTAESKSKNTVPSGSRSGTTGGKSIAARKDGAKTGSSPKKGAPVKSGSAAKTGTSAKPVNSAKKPDKGAKGSPAKQSETHRAVHTDIKAVRRNARSIRTLKRVMAVLIVLLIGIVIYITYPAWSAKLEGLFDRPVRTVFNNGDTEGGKFPIEPDNSVTGVYRVKNDLLTTDLHTMTFYDVNGEKKASYNHNFTNPVVRTAGKRVLVFDNGAFGFKLYKKGGETFSKTLDDTILTGALSESGVSAIVTTSDKFAASAKFFDKDGKLIYTYDSTARIMSLTLTDDGSSCYVCTFSSANGELSSQVRRLDLDKSGEQMVSEDIPALALGCMENGAGDIMAVCDTQFCLIGSDGKIRSTYEYSGELTSFALDRNAAAVLINGSTRNSGRLMIAQAGASDSATFRELTADTPVKTVMIDEDRVLLLGSEKAYAFDLTATLTATAEIGREYSGFTYIDSALYLLSKHGVDKIRFEM